MAAGEKLIRALLAQALGIFQPFFFFFWAKTGGAFLGGGGGGEKKKGAPPPFSIPGLALGSA